MRDATLDAIATHVAQVEDFLPLERIVEVVEATFTQFPPARRTLDLLTEFPDVLTAASPDTPPALATLLWRLREAGGTTVQPPRCAICGEQRVLRRVVQDGRACDLCSRSLAKHVGPCAICEQTRQLQVGPGGDAYCLGCWRGMKPDANDRIVVAVRAHRQISIAVIENAIAHLGSVRDQRVRLMLELEAHGQDWFSDPAAGSALFGTFYDVLRSAGARLGERRCGSCARARALTGRIDGRLSCRPCYRLAHQSECDGCGDTADLERVLSDGRKLCQRCTNKLPDENAACVSCGNHRLIAYRGPTGPQCSTCRAASRMDTCTVCGTIAPCRFHGTATAICKVCTDKASVDVCTICRNTRHCRWPGTPGAACEQCSNRRTPCVNCGEVRLRHKRADDGDGFLCWACTPQIIETCTGCGENRIVNGRVESRPFCALCYPQQPESFLPCIRCGTVTRLIAKHCPRCRADGMIREMIPDELAASDERIAYLRERWFLGVPSKVIYAFERGTVSCTLITRLLGDPTLRTHECLDAFGTEDRTRAVRSVLVDHNLLPRRDELLARFEAWLPVALAAIRDPSERRTVSQFARWRHLRDLRTQTSPSRAGQLSWRRIEIEGVVELLAWVHGRGGSLATLTQADIDYWLPRSRARSFLRHFFSWTTRTGNTRPLTAPAPRSSRLNPRSISDEERWRLLADVTSDDTIDPHTKFAAGLILMFGVRAAKIVQLRPEDVTVTEETVHVRLGTAPLVLPIELAPAAAAAARDRAAPRMFVDSIEQGWLYPGGRAGHHMASETLNKRLRRLGIPPRLGRTSALIALSQQLAPVVLSRLTGLEISSAIAWANAIGATDSVYAAAAAQTIGLRLPTVQP